MSTTFKDTEIFRFSCYVFTYFLEIVLKCFCILLLSKAQRMKGGLIQVLFVFRASSNHANQSILHRRQIWNCKMFLLYTWLPCLGRTGYYPGSHLAIRPSSYILSMHFWIILIWLQNPLQIGTQLQHRLCKAKKLFLGMKLFPFWTYMKLNVHWLLIVSHILSLPYIL